MAINPQLIEQVGSILAQWASFFTVILIDIHNDHINGVKTIWHIYQIYHIA